MKNVSIIWVQYDTIKTDTKEEKLGIMFVTPKKTKWEIPRFSKKEIEKAGKMFSTHPETPNEFYKSLEIINNWRASHAYPLHVITMNLRKNNPNAIVVQRLKRLDSIVGKLKRFNSMNLYRIQDLGGCRVIVDSVDEVYDSVKRFKKSRIRHVFKREKDYIAEPKGSGYRSYHLVYQYKSDRNEIYNTNMLIEIQFRTKLQHIWATAVEMMGIYTNTSLKSSMGDEEYLRFFSLVSSIFAIKENTPVCPDTPDNLEELIAEVKELDNKKKIIAALNAMKTATGHALKEDKNIEYYVLRLDYIGNALYISSFEKNEIQKATEYYNELEITYPTCDVVLVSAKDFNTLKSAYPNYFTDINTFIKIVTGIIYP